MAKFRPNDKNEQKNVSDAGVIGEGMNKDHGHQVTVWASHVASNGDVKWHSKIARKAAPS